MKKILFLLSFTYMINSCNGQKTDVAECKKHFISAKKAFDTYYTNQNSKLLNEALREVDLSSECSETRLASVELKISILSTKKDYVKAYKYIESLDDNDFTRVYSKEMQYNYFKALDFQSKSDLKNYMIYLKKAEKTIEDFIKNQNTINQEAYYDLFLIKSKILNKEDFNSYIDGLIKTTPSGRQLFELLRESFSEQTKQINAIQE